MPVDNDKFSALLEAVSGREPELPEPDQDLDTEDSDFDLEAYLAESSGSELKRLAATYFPAERKHQWHETLRGLTKNLRQNAADLDQTIDQVIAKLKASKEGYGSFSQEQALRYAFAEAIEAALPLMNASTLLRTLMKHIK